MRDATLSDIPVLVEMGRDLHAESPRYSVMRFSAQKVEALARRLLTPTLVTPPLGGVFVAEVGDKIVGMTAGFVSEHWFSDERIVSDYTLYVRPAWRGSSAARRLIRRFEAWARHESAKFSLLGVSTGIESQRTIQMYERLGYRLYGYALVKEL